MSENRSADDRVRVSGRMKSIAVGDLSTIACKVGRGIAGGILE